MVQKVKSNIGFGTFVRTEKESTTHEFLYAQCSKICRDSHNPERHMRQVHMKRQKEKRKIAKGTTDPGVDHFNSCSGRFGLVGFVW